MALPGSFFGGIEKKVAALNIHLNNCTEKYLLQLQKKEAKIKKKLLGHDSTAASRLFANNPEKQYADLARQNATDSAFDPKKITGEYLPYADSLQGMLTFFKNNQHLISPTDSRIASIQNSLRQLQQLQGRLQNAEQIKQFVRERKEQIKQYILNTAHLPPGIAAAYSGYNKDLYYYNQQLHEYKDALNDPDKLFQKVIFILSKFSVFRDFMKSNSILAALFPIPGNYGSVLALQGLQTRDEISRVIQSQLNGPDAQAALSQGFADGQSQLTSLKDRMLKYGQNGKDMDNPDFKPNMQKKKSFLKRLEYGTNMQSQHSTYFFPTTTDIGLTVGYRLNDRSTIGIGASYKIGWGSDIHHINLSSQGSGLRSFLDVKLKGSFYASGGLEYNYQQPGYLLEFKELNSWQQSGLIGISKIISIKSKPLKKTKVQFLWDLMSYRQLPPAQAFKFRVGYNF